MYQRNIRRKWTIVLAVFAFTFVMQQAFAQHTTHNDSVAATVSDTIDNDSAMAVIDADLNAMDPTAQGGGGLHKMLKQKNETNGDRSILFHKLNRKMSEYLVY